MPVEAVPVEVEALAPEALASETLPPGSAALPGLGWPLRVREGENLVGPSCAQLRMSSIASRGDRSTVDWTAAAGTASQLRIESARSSGRRTSSTRNSAQPSSTRERSASAASVSWRRRAHPAMSREVRHGQAAPSERSASGSISRQLCSSSVSSCGQAITGDASARQPDSTRRRSRAAAM